MSLDKGLQSKAIEVLTEADKHRWVHQTIWFKKPLLNLPKDMLAVQDIIWRTRPDYIIEVCVNQGGGLVFDARLLEMLVGKKVIGVDIFIPDDLRERLSSHGKLSERFELIKGSSTAPGMIDKIKNLDGSKKL